MNKQETLQKMDGMQLVLDFAKFCMELDEEEGTQTYDPVSFALLTSTLCEEV